MKNLSYDQAMNLIKLYNPILIDVQLNIDYTQKHLSGSINIPLEDLNADFKNFKIEKNQMIIVYCLKGIRSEAACDLLERLGYTNIYNIKDGIDN